MYLTEFSTFACKLINGKVCGPTSAKKLLKCMNYEELLGTFQGHPVVIQRGWGGGGHSDQHCLDFNLHFI